MPAKKPATTTWKQAIAAGTSALGLLRSLQQAAARRLADAAPVPMAPVPLPIEEKTTTTEITISSGTVVKVLFWVFISLALVQFLASIADTLILLLISVIFAEAINPVADRFERAGFGRGLGVITVYIGVFVMFGFALYLLIPLVASQVAMLAQNATGIINSLLRADVSEWPVVGPYLGGFVGDILREIDPSSLQQYLSQFSSQLSSVASTAGGALLALFNGFFNFLLFLVLTFFLVTNKQQVNNFIASLMPVRYRPYFRRKMTVVQQRVGAWLRGQVASSGIMALLTWVGLHVLSWFGLGIGYEETLAVLIFVAGFVPYLGTLLAALPALLLAINAGGLVWLWVLALYALLQQLEGNVLQPLVMGKAVGISPVALLLGVLVAVSFPEYLNPVVAVLIAVPVLTIISSFVEDLQADDAAARPQ